MTEPEQRRTPSVAAVLVIVAMTGCTLGCLQGAFIFKGLSYCLDTQFIYDDPGPRLKAVFEILVRMGLYGLALPVAATPFILLARHTARGRWLAAAVGAAVVCGSLAFIADYTALNGIGSWAAYHGAQETVAQRCPGDRPPWWPF